MNSIVSNQNSPPFLRLLKARQQIYRDATNLQVAQFILSVVTPIVASIIGLIFDLTRPYVGIFAIIITIADIAYLDRQQRQMIKVAAKISERYDCELLQMPWNKFVANKEIDEEQIEEAAQRWPHGERQLLDWYPAAVSRAPLYIARIVCQRSNLWYDSSLRRTYCATLGITIVAICALLFLGGIVRGLSLIDFLTTILVPIAPILLWAIRERFRQRDTADAVEFLKNEAEALFDRVRSGSCSENECFARSRELQDAIYNRRYLNPLIFPFVYKIFRKKMEMQMNAGADEFLKRMGI